MVRRNWILAVLCIAAAVLLCNSAFGGKCEKKGSLPAAVEAAVKALYPNAVIEETKVEMESVKAYEVEVEDGSAEHEITIAEDGTVMEVSSEESMDSLPAAVAQTIEAQNAEVKEIEKEVEYAEVVVVELDVPKTTYEVELIKDGEEIELEIGEDGTILEEEVQEKKCHKHEDDDDEELDD
jgi:hypothetical protein